ncbi:MAG: hypothetical protein HOP08_04825 [Cyclobacteriaceae bacterium]|nr:hypothetical protein [Cyclobacteriaceae bacterium]
MIRAIQFLLLITVIGCTNKESGDEIIKPKWDIGDYRLFTEKGYYFAKVNDDTIANVSYEKSIKITVFDKNQMGYILQVEILPLKELAIRSSEDSLETKYNSALDILKDLTKHSLPYQLRISSLGEFTEVVDFENYYVRCLNELFKVADTLKIEEKDRQTLLQITKSDSSTKERFRENLWNGIDDYFALYSKVNSINQDFSEEVSMPYPKTGEPTPATLTYHTTSVDGDIQEIELTVKLGQPLSSIQSDTLKINPTKKIDLNNMRNVTKYSYNQRTSWLEKIESNVNFKTDTVDVRIVSNVRVVK